MRKKFYTAIISSSLMSSALIAQEDPLIGVVNFATCITESKYGKQEQESLENLRKQLTSLIENTEKEMKEIGLKFDDAEYLDSLSPKAEEEMKLKFQGLQEDLARYQNQFYQVMNHAQYQLVQRMSSNIAQAAEKVASAKNLNYVMNREACFYIRPDFDVTHLVITEMDRSFDLAANSKKLSESREVSSLPEEMPNLPEVEEEVR